MTSAIINQPRSARDTNAAAEPTELSEEAVALYLQRNPDFFRRHANVLADMSLPHNSGNAVSLIERQVAILRERSIQTRHKLGELMEAAKDNDALFNTTQSLVIDLLNTESINSTFVEMEQQLKQNFGVETASIALISSDSENKSASSEAIEPRFIRHIDDAKIEITGIINNSQSLCGTLREQEADFIFPAASRAIGSVALTTRKITDGSKEGSLLMLAVAHHNAEHYNSNTGTLFLDYLCDILTALVKRHS